jgi:hypothetical protein
VAKKVCDEHMKQWRAESSPLPLYVRKTQVDLVQVPSELVQVSAVPHRGAVCFSDDSSVREVDVREVEIHAVVAAAQKMPETTVTEAAPSFVAPVPAVEDVWSKL